MGTSELGTDKSEDTKHFFFNLAKCNISKPNKEVSDLNQNLYIFLFV